MTRIFTALVLLTCFIPAIFYLLDLWWALLTLLLSMLALHEWAKMIGLSKSAVLRYVVISALFALLLLYFMHENFHGMLFHSLQLFMLVALFWLLLVPIWLAKTCTLKNIWLNMALGWFLIGPLWLALVCAKRINPTMLLVVISTIWIADSAAYFAGKNFGKHKLAPSISPGKTWEGVIGALIAVTIFAAVIIYYQAFDSWLLLPALWLITIAGVYGDLFESMFKRQANLKDSGQLLPGHGGILDRIDGLVPALPIGVLMFYLYHYYQAANVQSIP
ncbi:MAG TPA: phosphatidate cytidylyltransferase [Methylophilus sp.]